MVARGWSLMGVGASRWPTPSSITRRQRFVKNTWARGFGVLRPCLSDSAVPRSCPERSSLPRRCRAGRGMPQQALAPRMRNAQTDAGCVETSRRDVSTVIAASPPAPRHRRGAGSASAGRNNPVPRPCANAPPARATEHTPPPSAAAPCHHGTQDPHRQRTCILSPHALTGRKSEPLDIGSRLC